MSLKVAVIPHRHLYKGKTEMVMVAGSARGREGWGVEGFGFGAARGTDPLGREGMRSALQPPALPNPRHSSRPPSSASASARPVQGPVREAGDRLAARHRGHFCRCCCCCSVYLLSTHQASLAKCSGQISSASVFPPAGTGLISVSPFSFLLFLLLLLPPRLVLLLFFPSLHCSAEPDDQL